MKRLKNKWKEMAEARNVKSSANRVEGAEMVRKERKDPRKAKRRITSDESDTTRGIRAQRAYLCDTCS
uniref:Uncharacterized protein n=1 Tax=Peronospora matthiolae TaxID=2874970 RepID=A0AAV1TVN8_9STRA